MTNAVPIAPRGRSAGGDDLEPWIGYIRVSTWKEEKISPELQEQAIRAWAARTGRRILEPLVVDLDMTGRNFKRRVMSAIERVEAGEARGIVVWRFSRFGRNMAGVQANLARVEAVGGQLESATEPADARTAVGGLQRDMHFAFAAFESNRAGEGWRETHDHRRYRLHLPASGRPRWGYIWHPRRIPDPATPTGWRLQEERYEPHPALGPVVADQYRQYIDGAPFYTLVAGLNDAGHRTVRGGLWTVQTLSSYLDSGFAAGLLRIHDPQHHCTGDRRRGCTTYIHIPGAHAPLISADLWQEYRDRREQVRATPPRSRTATHPLSGLVRCGQCHGTAPIHSKVLGPAGDRHTVRGYSYQCGRRGMTGGTGCTGVYAKRTEVEAEVRAWLAREAAAGIDHAPAVPAPRPAEDPRERAARDRERLQAEADRYAAALTNLRVQRAADPDDWGPGEYEAARDRIRQQQATALAALERAAAVVATPARGDHMPELTRLLERWEVYDDAQRNRVLRSLLRRVALVQTGSGVRFDVHPIWEPDPWEPVE